MTRNWSDELEFDHVVVAVDDLQRASEHFLQAYGLRSVPGGRHRGFGTANHIIPLGSSYVELMAVADEATAATSPLARWIADAASRDAPAALCLRTRRIDEVAETLGQAPLPMERQDNVGRAVRWRLVGLLDSLQDASLPFFIQWDSDPSTYPGALDVEHPAGDVALTWIEVAADPERLRRRLGEHRLDLRSVEGAGGVHAVGLETETGEVVIRSG